MILAFMPVGAGMGEYLLLLLVVLLVYGPRRLPDIARRLGHLRLRMQQAADGFRDQILRLEDDAKSTVEPSAPLSSPDLPAPPTGDPPAPATSDQATDEANNTGSTTP